MSTTWPLTVSVAAKAGAVRATTNAAIAIPANVLRMEISLKKPDRTLLLIPRLILYCAYEEGAHSDSSGVRQRRGPAGAESAGGSAACRADRRSDSLAEARRLAGDLTRWALGRLHDPRDE